ncbi:MAG TPA: glutamine synthetase family protein [Actinophytocola sp.]|uniref:glutamine synthetase family protein n=1 Tax=Actinophytocola sp. TaxID=1872138 RepID=UPI002DBE7DE2|nr:glutamine synthetase family protein [Actinophytocola sp.]HEU5471440.1 glutamine synthetase family protein [Actinophytocola sp.]
MATVDRIPAGEPNAAGRIDELERSGVELVELSFMDNAGIVRVKTVPLGRLAAAAAAGVGASPCFETFSSADIMAVGRHLGGPDGDLRLVPDLDRAVALAGVPGWAWAPADKFTQDGTRFAACQRAFAARQVAAAGEHGLTLRMAVEHEWILGRSDAAGFVPAFDGPAYGQIRLEQVAGYARELVADLHAQGVPVDQFHPEYAPAQLELSVAARDPVGAADDAVLVRHTVRARSLRHGWRATFAPTVDPDGAGSGAHLHLSVHDADGSAMAGGSGPAGLRPAGEAFLAGVLRELPALVAVGAGHPASFLRLQPSRWAGVWQCWGVETRETAIRMVTGLPGTGSSAANAEVKCFDGTANPYLLVGAVIAAGLAGVAGELRLPRPVTGDPALLDPVGQAAAGIHRLPTTAGAAADALASSAVLAGALGPELHDALLTVRRAEAAACADLDAAALAEATRWRW